MKLRMKGNSIRLRLTKTEVAQIQTGGRVTEIVSFGSGSELYYHLEPSLEVAKIQAKFETPHLRVLLPAKIAKTWAQGETVSLLSDQTSGQAEPLLILIEKDFFCLKPRTHQSEDESDMFVNPNEAHGSCG